MLTNYIKRSVIIAIALAVGFLLYGLLPYEEPTNKGLALLAFVAILWLTEAIHITVTALLQTLQSSYSLEVSLLLLP